MSYSSRHSLGALATATYPSGTQLVAGYRITGLTRPAGEVPDLLRQAMQAAFRGTTVRTGWGGGGDAFGVPSGHVYALVRTGVAGVTSDTMNGIFSRVASDLQSRLGGGTVTNTHAHVAGGGGGGGSPGIDPSTFLNIAPSPPLPGMTPPGMAPPGMAPPGSEYMPPAYDTLPAEGSFLTSTVGGVPMWGLLLGGTVVVGGLGYLLLSRKS
jgi:hypothetical protein